MSAAAILELRNEHNAARTLRTAICASQRLRQSFRKQAPPRTTGVKIWSGPSADPSNASSKLPSISESPLERDFTIEGTPSRLGCPFASMAGKKLSSHAASVLSRYNGSQGAKDGLNGSNENGSTAASATSRFNGRESLAARAAPGDRRNSFADPIKAEICGLDDHSGTQQPSMVPNFQDHVQDNTDTGVCPIRFLDQHSPEEVATYFEKHKHELPRSHEVCVRRYQGDEKQVRELDARYGNMVQMIRGLGEKHVNFLPKEPDEGDGGGDVDDSKDHGEEEKVRQWASSVSIQGLREPGGSRSELGATDAEAEGEEVRESHFSRPLRDVRVGESPSRPWGVPVPAAFLERADSEGTSHPAQVNPAPFEAHPARKDADEGPIPKKARCPFAPGAAALADAPNTESHRQRADLAASEADAASPQSPEPGTAKQPTPESGRDRSHRQVLFTGPVLIGYSPEDAARFLRESGLGGRT